MNNGHMNNRGFTLVEVLAVIAIVAIIGAVSVPGILNTIHNSKKSSYDMMLKNIKTAGNSLFEEVEFGDNNLYQYYSDGGKSSTKLKINQLNSGGEEVKIYQISTNLQTLVSNGFLKGTTVEKSGQKVLIFQNPMDDKNIGFCQIFIRKIVNISTGQTSYEILGNSDVSSCPETVDYQETLQTKDIFNYEVIQKQDATYYFLNNHYKFYSGFGLDKNGQFTNLSNEMSFSNYMMDENGKRFYLQSSGSFFVSYSISVSSSSASTRVISNSNYRYAKSLRIINNNQFSLVSSVALTVPTTANPYTFFNSSVQGGMVYYINNVSSVSSSNGQNRYRVSYSAKNITYNSGSIFLSNFNSYAYSSSYDFDGYNGTYQLSGNISRSNAFSLKVNSYTCLSSASSCKVLYRIKEIDNDKVLVEVYSANSLMTGT